jgi:hypothetical protein
MLKQLRQQIIASLWQHYCDATPQMRVLEQALRNKGIANLRIDHFAIIDLPGPHTGIHQLNQLFSALGYLAQGCDYLPEKQNDFLWLTEHDSLHTPAINVLPQVVVADFRLAEMPMAIRTIIEKYAALANPYPLLAIHQLIGAAYLGDKTAATKIHTIVCDYLRGRDWPLPTVSEFQQVQAFNELLAWVLIFGRRPNHFTISVHLLEKFASLQDFHQFASNEVGLILNTEGGIIKGGAEAGIAQGSTISDKQCITLADGVVELSTGFIEFAWRYPKEHLSKPYYWNDYFTGFVARQATYVIESLYNNNIA